MSTGRRRGPRTIAVVLRALGLGSTLQFALITLGGLALIVTLATGLLYLVGQFPWWINAALILSTVVLAIGAIQVAVSWWRSRDAKLYFAQLTVALPSLLMDIDLARGVARVQPYIELVNLMPERLDYQMLAFSAKVARRHGRLIKPEQGVVVQGLQGGFSGPKFELPIRAGQRIDAVFQYDLIYGPSTGDRYLIRERRSGLLVGGIVRADGTFVQDARYTATTPPVTEIIKGGLPK